MQLTLRTFGVEGLLVLAFGGRSMLYLEGRNLLTITFLRRPWE